MPPWTSVVFNRWIQKASLTTAFYLSHPLPYIKMGFVNNLELYVCNSLVLFMDMSCHSGLKIFPADSRDMFQYTCSYLSHCFPYILGTTCIRHQVNHFYRCAIEIFIDRVCSPRICGSKFLRYFQKLAWFTSHSATLIIPYVSKPCTRILRVPGAL